jgi:hypothetical protein
VQGFGIGRSKVAMPLAVSGQQKTRAACRTAPSNQKPKTLPRVEEQTKH